MAALVDGPPLRITHPEVGTVTEQERVAAIRRGTRKTERRARRYAALIRKAIEVLDNLAEELETELDKP
jgi:hypothetical protein